MIETRAVDQPRDAHVETVGRNACDAPAAAAWAHGATRLYDPLATAITSHIAADLRGARVLDAGAGTGAMCRALRRAGALPVALDLSYDMLSFVGDAAVAAVAGDLLALPFRDSSFDAAVSAFAVSHLSEPQRALAEMQRVVRVGGSLAVAVFGAAPPNASKDIVDEIAADFGFVRPAWYDELKTSSEPLSNTPELLRELARAAGLQSTRVIDMVPVSGLTTPTDIVAYRSGMAHLAPFLATLTDDRRAAFTARAISSVERHGQAVGPRVLILSSVVAA